MKNIFISLSIISMTYLGSCSGKETADLVIINGKILTIDKDNPLPKHWLSRVKPYWLSVQQKKYLK